MYAVRVNNQAIISGLDIFEANSVLLAELGSRTRSGQEVISVVQNGTTFVAQVKTADGIVTIETTKNSQ